MFRQSSLSMHTKPLMAPLILLMLGACIPSTKSTITGSTGKPFRITLIAGTTADNFYATMNCGARTQALKLGVEYSFTGPNHFDAQAQIPIVNTVTAQRPDAVLIAPTDVTALIQPMRAMKAAGIRVIEVDTAVTDRSIAVSQISSDNLAGGKLAADTLAQLLGEKGTVLVINVNPGISTTDARDQGFREQMASKYPGIRVLPTQYNNDDQSRASQILTSTYAAHPELNGVFAANTISAEGAATGVRNAGATGRIFTVGFDAEPQSIQDLEKGVVQALIAQQPAQIGAQGILQAVRSLSGDPVQADVGTDLVAITKANMTTHTEYFYKSSC